MSWSVDGMAWDIPCTIQRVAEVRSSDISGMMLDKTYFNDALVTWLKYTIAIAVPKGYEGEYAALYELLTDPVNYHEFNLPYNYDGSGVNIVGRVETVSDTYVRLPKGGQTWRKTTFEIISNTPTKEATLGEIRDHGLSPYPSDASATVGDIYEYTETGWIQRFYGDGDDTRY